MWGERTLVAAEDGVEQRIAFREFRECVRDKNIAKGKLIGEPSGLRWLPRDDSAKNPGQG